MMRCENMNIMSMSSELTSGINNQSLSTTYTKIPQ
jgi:hypothetical protein